MGLLKSAISHAAAPSGDANLITIPRNINDVESIDHDAEVEAASVGLEAAQVEAVWKSVRKFYRSRTQPFISFGLYKSGQCVLKRSIGHLHNAPGTNPGNATVGHTDTPVCLFSASKSITATLIHMLAERGLVDLDAPICDYVREFRQKGKKNCTVSQLLAHRAGIPTVPGKNPSPELLYDWNGAVQLLCGAKPVHRGGKQVAYHAITGGFILGEIARRVTGCEMRELLDRYLRTPLGLRYFNYGLSAEDQPDRALDAFTGKRPPWLIGRMAKRALGAEFHTVPDVSNDARFADSIIPAGNIYATADEVCQFYSMLLAKGRWNDQQLMAPETVARLTREAAPRQWDRTLMVPVRFSEGMLLGDNPVGLYGRNSAACFGHLGFINTLTWADPVRDTAVSLITTGKPAVGPHLVSLVRVVNSVSRLPAVR